MPPWRAPQALDIWQDWAESPDCDVTRTQPFAELEDLAYRSRLQSGDILFIRRFKERDGRLLATCWQAVEADRLSNPNWKADSEEIAGGVEFDSQGNSPLHEEGRELHRLVAEALRRRIVGEPAIIGWLPY